MKRIIVITFLLIAFISNAQKIKVKGDNDYYKVYDNNENIAFHFKLITEKSKVFNKFRRNNYYMLYCPTENDTIGIEKEFFYLGQKKMAKYLVKNNLLDNNGINVSKLKEKLAATTTKIINYKPFAIAAINVSNQI